ncbi:MAG: hypothetical protein HXX12_15120 [Geothrix sp.]|uniref:hypothetical protein n=1 Tax=Geothrix sp. TaxID=1962974 RepID=UPI0017F6A6D8|nr:hypothetical protein [Geothrix sp.]NWJ42292.1 hypothetical protein [Geothrix sp.]WIL19741.1 MAG: hypothetical protein QOZ81_002272 [Geothrix sp.]
MPPGNARTKLPVKVIERATAEACLAIAQKVQHARELAGDEAGSEAARQVARVIAEEVLRVG